MTTTTDRALSSRLDRLEREARRWRAGALGLGLALVASLGLSAKDPARPASPSVVQDEVRAKRLVLVDADGAEAGVLELDGKQNPHLLLRKEQRLGVLTLSGPGLLVRDGRRGAFVGVNTQGASTLELTGEDLTQGARVTVQEDGSTGFYALEKGGKQRVGIELLSTGHAQFTARDAEGLLRLQQGVDPLGNASTALFDGNGIPRIGMVAPAEGSPTLASEDERGRTRAQLVQGFDGAPRLEFLNENGDAFWKRPE